MSDRTVHHRSADVMINIDRTPTAEGNYGRILKCWHNDGDSQIEIIAKMIDEHERIGDSIMEGIIMSSFDHPHIVRSIRPPIIHTFYRKQLIHELPVATPTNPIPTRTRRLKIPFIRLNKRQPEPQPLPTINSTNRHAGPDDDVKWKRVLYFQESAIGDLDNCPWTGQHLQIVYIAWQLLNAIYAMHNENLIHVDIKPSNILYYNEVRPEVRLTDFSLSVVNNGKNRGSSGSPYYTAPEALADEHWNEKIDLWSLGCTLYYLYYGEILFPIQQVNAYDDAERRRIRRLRELKAIVHWSNSSIHMARVMEVTEFNPVVNCRLFEKNSFNDLLRSMLEIDPKRRSSARDLLRSDIFTIKQLVPYKVIDISSEPLEDRHISMIKRLCYTRQRNLDEILFRTATKLASRVWELTSIIPVDQLILSAVSISYTLINGCVLLDLGSNDEYEDMIISYSGMQLLCILNERQ